MDRFDFYYLIADQQILSIRVLKKDQYNSMQHCDWIKKNKAPYVRQTSLNTKRYLVFRTLMIFMGLIFHHFKSTYIIDSYFP